MNLTKEQRLECYKGALEDIKTQHSNYFYKGICPAMTIQFRRILGGVWFCSDAKKLLPELAALEPKQHNGYWFENNEERIEVLTKIINDLENEIL